MGRPPRVERTYSPQEKQKALLQLAMNKGNLARTSQSTGIPTITLYRWRESGFAEFALARAKMIDEFMDTIMKNIRELNKPGFIKQLKEKILEKGNLKAVADYTAIMMDKMMQLKRTQLLGSSSVSQDQSP
ncbi:unnamed protein product, partial [marine sediment metagenome]